MRVTIAAICLSWLSISSLASAAEEKAASPAELAAQKEQLSKVQKLVGSWKGVGQPQRGSTKDSWIETADWAWRFSPERTTLFTRTEKGKFFSKLELIAGETAGSYTLLATPARGAKPFATRENSTRTRSSFSNRPARRKAYHSEFRSALSLTANACWFCTKAKPNSAISWCELPKSA